MSRVSWLDPGERFFEAGVDRGVLYVKNQPNRSSLTNHSVGLGTRTFSLLVSGNEKAFTPGTVVKAWRPSVPTTFMVGEVVTSSVSSVTLNVTEVGGSGGPYNNWMLTRVDLAVPWNGLTGVDEKGGDGSKAYYIDGRPFLFIPQPKEYSATLKAYTYPDEFSALQGVVEATDGMFLDSQQFDSFDFSYRTLVGNDIDGIDHGYKIHIVYNATVVPSSLSYQSNTSEINPTEMSWEIQAVPVPIEGYRPTAHVIIDTRHMDAEKIAQIEELLYGSDTAWPEFPDPQEVFDILTFGDGITIVDNGDGTWEAIGSYANIYMIGDGIFQIDNVNATDLGDGTYNISSTP